MTKLLFEVKTQSLEDRYNLKKQRLEEQLLLHDERDKLLFKRKTQLKVIRVKCRKFELASFNSATLWEKQKRELLSKNE